MKNLTTFAFFILLSLNGLSRNAHASPGMICGGISDSAGKDEASGECYTEGGQSYHYEMTGIGIGLQSSLQGFAIYCPNVRKSRMSTMDFYGLEVTASPLLGAEAAVFSNRHLGTCIMTGLNFGLGVSVNIDRLSFREN